MNLANPFDLATMSTKQFYRCLVGEVWDVVSGAGERRYWAHVEADIGRSIDRCRRAKIGKLKSVRSCHYTGTDGRKVRAS